jgi:hypothetical protein
MAADQLLVDSVVVAALAALGTSDSATGKVLTALLMTGRSPEELAPRLGLTPAETTRLACRGARFVGTELQRRLLKTTKKRS